RSNCRREPAEEIVSAMSKKLFVSTATAAMLALLATTPLALADIWTEVGDAGSAGIGAAQVTMASPPGIVNPLTAITGALGRQDSDLYAIFIFDPAGFSATTVGGATFDTQLQLFNAAGIGVMFNDDVISTSRQSLLPTVAGGRPASIALTTPGIYYIGISQ